MARFVNLIYAMLIDGLDADQRGELDDALDEPTEYEMAVASRYLAGTAPTPAVVRPPAWFGAEADDLGTWAAEPRRG